MTSTRRTRRQIPCFGCGNTAKAGITVRTDTRSGGAPAANAREAVWVEKLRVHPGHLDAIGGDIASAATTPPSTVPATLPPGRDPVSVAAADAVAARTAQMLAYSAHAIQVVAAAGVMLRAIADAYAQTETSNARVLSTTGSGAISTPSSTEILSPPTPPTASAPSGPLAAPTFTGRQIAELLTAAPGRHHCPRPPPT
jgi:hypothetical protein